MNYVEWLRVRNCMRIVAIVFGIMLVLTLAARIWLAVQFGSDQALVEHIKTEPGTVTQQSLYEGRPRTTIVNAREHVRVTIDDRAGGGKAVTIQEPRSGHAEHDAAALGSVKITTTTGPATKTTVIETDEAVPVAIYLAIGSLLGLIVATVLGASFARENEGHLEFALLRPVTRERFAFGVIGVDLAGIVIAEVMAMIAMVIGQAMFEVPRFDFSHLTVTFVLLMFAVPFSWYAMLNAASASLKRGAGAVVGFSWPVGFLVVALSKVDVTGTPIGDAFHAVFWTISRLIPLTYGSVQFDNNTGSTTVSGTGNPSTNLLVVIVLLLAYGALSVLQWRRVEA